MSRGIDVPGAVTFSAGLFLLIFADGARQRRGLGQHADRRLLHGGSCAPPDLPGGADPQPRAMFDLSLFRNRSFVGRVARGIHPLGRHVCAVPLHHALDAERLGYSPLEAGAAVPAVDPALIRGGTALRQALRAPVARRHARPGLGLVGGGRAADDDGVNATSGWTALLPGLIVAGTGIGVTNPALATTAVGVVDVRRSGMASGINNTFRRSALQSALPSLGLDGGARRRPVCVDPDREGAAHRRAADR